MACLALAAWALVSAALARDPSGAVLPIQLVGCLMAVVLVVRRLDEEDRDLLVAGVVVVGSLVAATGWWGAVGRHDPWGLVDGGLWRAASTITYANGTSAFLTIVALVALARAVETPNRAWRAGAFLCIVGLGTTLSRAGLVAFVAGAAVLVAMLGWRRTIASTWPVFGGAALAVVAALPGLPADRPSRPLLAALGLLAGAAGAVAGGRLAARVPVIVVVVVAAAVGVGLVVGLAHATRTSGTLAGRVSLDSPDRRNEWRSALTLAHRHPLAGVGPTNAVFSWPGPDGRLRAVNYAHNEWLQVLASEGVVGLGMLVIGVGIIAKWVKSRLPSVPGWVGAGTVSAGLAATLHGSVDFVWHIPLVPVLGAVLLGLIGSRAPTMPSAPTTDRP